MQLQIQLILSGQKIFSKFMSGEITVDDMMADVAAIME